MSLRFSYGGVALALYSLTAHPAPRTTAPAPASADSVLDRALSEMGGEATARRVTRARFETLTLWHRMTFENRPFGEGIASYERGSELRDYAIGGWRNTRRFISGAPTSIEIVDVVTDTVAARFAPPAPTAERQWGPLSVAYVDERDELFSLAPERLLLAARAADDRRALADTTIDGARYARVTATVAGVRHALHLRRGDGLLAFTAFRAAQPRDFGLAPYGTMDVEVWYSRWQLVPLTGTPGLVYPMQMDVRRAGVAYKRVTLLGARFDVPPQADSFAVAPALRSAFLTTARAAMWAIPRDSARLVDSTLAQLGPIGPTPMALRVGGKWWILEGSAVPQRAEEDDRWLAEQDKSSGGVYGALVTTPTLTMGGTAWLVRVGCPVFASQAATRSASVILKNWGGTTRGITFVSRGRWIRSGSDSLWVEPVDLPGTPGAMVVWVPSLRTAYSALGASPVAQQALRKLFAARGWQVEREGSARGFVVRKPAG